MVATGASAGQASLASTAPSYKKDHWKVLHTMIHVVLLLINDFIPDSNFVLVMLHVHLFNLFFLSLHSFCYSLSLSLSPVLPPPSSLPSSLLSLTSSLLLSLSVADSAVSPAVFVGVVAGFALVVGVLVLMMVCIIAMLRKQKEKNKALESGSVHSCMSYTCHVHELALLNIVMGFHVCKAVHVSVQHSV